MQCLLGMVAWFGLAFSVAARAQGDPPPPATGRVEGLVVDALAQPIAAADVWLVDRANQRGPSTKTDGSGMFVLSKLPLPENGYWRVRATAPGRIEADDWARPSQGVGTARLQLFDAARLTGQIVDHEAKPVAGAEVMVSFNRSRAARTRCVATTDAEGKFALDAVPVGYLDVRATAPGFECAASEVHVTGKAEGEPPLRVALTPGTGLDLEVEVTGLSAEEAQKATVSLLPYIDGSLQDLPPSLLRGTLDGAGKWRVRGLPKAEYKVSVTSPGASFEPREVTMYAQFRGTRILGAPPPATDVSIARFRAHRNQSVLLRGRLLDEAEKGIAGETVVARASNGGREAVALTDKEGVFSLQSPLAPGVDCVFFLRNSEWITVQAPPANDPNLDRRDLLWHRAKVDPKEELVLRAKRPALVRGRLVDGEGQPVRWTAVQLEESLSQRMPIWMTWARATSARDGTLTFRVPKIDDPVRVLVEGPSGTAVSREVELRWGETCSVGDIVMAPAAAVAGTVRDEQQKPLAGARVWLRDWDMGAGRQKSGSVVETITDRQGRYRFVGVPPGGAYLQVALRGERMLHKAVEPFEVKSGEQLQFDLVCPER
jgi:protocatechuate 3,4-dioxygenase beta subunit